MIVRTTPKLPTRFFLFILFLCCIVFSRSAIAQNAVQATLLLSPDTDCVVVFDGENLGTILGNTVKKVKADMGEHVLVANFPGTKTLKKIVTVSNANQQVITIPTPVYERDTTKKTTKRIVPQLDIDTATLTPEKATELYKAELLRPSPVDINRLKYLLSKGVDIHTADVHGWTLLHEAAYQGDTDLLKTCLEKGLPIDAKSIYNFRFSTPLSCATDQHHPEAMRILLSHNATYGIEDGYAEMAYDSGNRYKGGYKNGKKSGHGTLYYRDGTIYEGEWEKDGQDGKGTMTWTNGDKYKGEWKDGWRTGAGTYTWGNGDKYEGNWSGNNKNGQGTYYYASGDRYEGNWSYGKKNGQGIMYAANGGRYEGNWVNDMKNGQGKYYFANGDKFSGNYENNYLNGPGVFEWQNGDKYDGNFSNGSLEGQGTMYLASGGKRVGRWVNGLQNGEGIYYYASGDRYEGNFSNGQRDGKGSFYFADSTIYTGDWKNDKKSGYGILKVGSINPGFINYCDKCKTYKGYWQDDLKNGDGGCYDNNGILIYEGTFVNDYPSPPYPNR